MGEGKERGGVRDEVGTKKRCSQSGLSKSKSVGPDPINHS